MSGVRTIVFSFAVTVGLAAAIHGLRGASHESYMATQRYEDVYYLPPREWLTVFSLGWDEALADLIWMRSLIYFGDEMVNAGDVEHVFDYGEAIEALDPRFLAVYRWVGVAGLYRPQAISPLDIERSVEFMERGAEIYPEEGPLAWDIGAALVFELAPMVEETDPDRARAARERGMPFLVKATELGAAPEWAALSNASMLSRIGRTEQAVRHLQEMYLAVDDPATRASIAERIRDLQARADAEAVVEMARQLDERRQRDYPYLPLALYLMVGERPVADVETPMREGLAPALASELDRQAAASP